MKTATQRGSPGLPAALFVLILVASTAAFAENVDPDNDGSQYAWGENIGWCNTEPQGDDGPGMNVTDSGLSGWIWGENIGWISLSCINTTSCGTNDYGVTNDALGNLAGYAWAENAGWISFSCANTGTCGTASYGVTIDPFTGDFSGRAWGEITGWITFASSGPNPYKVKTAWTCTNDDGDGYCITTDCDDGVSTCTTDCVTNVDGDALPDCNDTCLDSDADGYGQPGAAGDTCLGADCNDVNNQDWSFPGPARSLMFSGDKETLTWTLPADEGGSATHYDTLRSTSAADFLGSSVCVETDGADTNTLDSFVPTTGVSFYLVRSRNTCGTEGPLVIGVEGSGDGQFSEPYGMAVDSDGWIYVADYLNDRIQIFDPNGAFDSSFGESGAGDGQFTRPVDVAVDGAGRIWVSDQGNDRIQIFDHDGIFVSKFGSTGTGPGQFNGPGYLQLSPGMGVSGLIFVVDFGNNRVQVFSDDTGTFVSEFNGVPGPGAFTNPTGIATDALGRVYVMDHSNDRVVVFSDEFGSYLAEFGVSGSSPGQFSFPWDVSVDDAGRVLVTDQSRNVILVFDQTWAFLTEFGGSGQAPGEFIAPAGVRVDHFGKIYVSELGNDRIQVFNRPVLPSCP